MRSIFVVGVAVAALGCAPAFAADIPVKAPVYPVTAPVFNWGGCYVGGDIGYAWQRDKDDEFVAATGAPSGFSPAATHPHGIKGGGYFGCNWQPSPNWVFGLEADVEAVRIGHSRGIYAPSTDFYESRTDFQDSIRGRIGYAIDRSLLYVTGGVAFASINDHYVGVIAGTVQDVTTTRAGWTLGGGWEYAFTHNWIGRIEYRYSDFGSVTNQNISFGAALVNERHRTTEDAIRIGIAYKYGGPL